MPDARARASGRTGPLQRLANLSVMRFLQFGAACLTPPAGSMGLDGGDLDILTGSVPSVARVAGKLAVDEGLPRCQLGHLHVAGP
jgi:hypothetical protein